MRLTIDSDGTRKGTRLLAEHGSKSEEVEGVEKITWEFNQDEEFVTATVKVREVGLSVKADCSKEVL
jgi:hypothetical protein